MLDTGPGKRGVGDMTCKGYAEGLGERLLDLHRRVQPKRRLAPQTVQRFRRRQQSAIWKQRKRGRRRYTELRRPGVDVELAAQTARSMHGPWLLANSLGFAQALPNAYFVALDLPRLHVRT